MSTSPDKYFLNYKVNSLNFYHGTLPALFDANSIVVINSFSSGGLLLCNIVHNQLHTLIFIWYNLLFDIIMHKFNHFE